MQLLPRIDHIQEGLSRLISQYRNKPRIATWIAIYLQQLQYVEDAIAATVNAWSLEDATGWRLDVIGTRVGQSRIGSTDAEYRLWIQARIAANRSTGRTRDLLKIADLLIPGYTYDLTSGNAHFYAPAGTLTRETAEVVRAILQFAINQTGRVWLHWSSDSVPLTRSSAGECLVWGSDTWAIRDGGHAPLNQTGFIPGRYTSILG